ncbi:hypothetical protein [Radicibacter daui]|uniref:hypothetical protein n=1 Tax=Radicibacter daui TaxID=3064829 RepID=UPI004046EAF9
MSLYEQNPFPAADTDRHAIWQMLVERDITAFLAADWSLVAEDFIEEGFMGIHAHWSPNPDAWRMAWDLAGYRAEWLRQAQETQRTAYKGDLRAGIFMATVLRDIDINGELALVHKKFDGLLERADGTPEPMSWQTLYFCRKVGGRWKIAGFTGYMPNPIAGSRGR